MNYDRILLVLYPGAEWVLDDVTDFSTLRWLDKNIPKPTLSEIEAGRAAAEVVIAAEEQKRLAAREFRANWPYEKIVEFYKAGGQKRAQLVAALNAVEL